MSSVDVYSTAASGSLQPADQGAHGPGADTGPSLGAPGRLNERQWDIRDLTAA